MTAGKPADGLRYHRVVSTASRKRRKAVSAQHGAAVPAPALQPERPPRPRGPVAHVAAAILALAPCFWQARIQAGDLASHIYNAWLAQLIQQGKAPGLAIVPQYTNVMFDLLLSVLFNAFGPDAAQRIAVALAVLVFAGGAFTFCRAVSRNAWSVLPLVIALAYGWTFHMGFFNFYLGLGFCFWALAAGWELRRKGLVIAAGFFVLALVAHGLAVPWAAGALGWRWAARRWESARWVLFGLALAGVAALRIAVGSLVQARWDAYQPLYATGAFQLWVYGRPFMWAAVALGVLWVALMALRVAGEGARAVFSSDIFLISALTAAGILAIPNAVWLTAYHHPLVYISERMSLALAVCLCALAAPAAWRAWQECAAGAVALVFFALLYPAELKLNRLEDAEASLLAGLPRGARVISSVEAPYIQVIALTHLIDRECIGRCYSYANYEPATGQFRIRVTGAENIVAPTDQESWDLQSGTYLVRQQDLPLYQIFADAYGKLHLRPMPAGRRNGLTAWNGLGK